MNDGTRSVCIVIPLFYFVVHLDFGFRIESQGYLLVQDCFLDDGKLVIVFWVEAEGSSIFLGQFGWRGTRNFCFSDKFIAIVTIE